MLRGRDKHAILCVSVVLSGDMFKKMVVLHVQHTAQQ